MSNENGTPDNQVNPPGEESVNPAPVGGKAEAIREKIRLQREAEEKKKQRKNTIWGSLAAVALLAAAGGTAAAILSANDGDDNLASISTEEGGPQNVEDGAILVGQEDAPVEADLYFDYMCPACKNFEDELSGTIDELVDAGDLKINYRPIAILDNMSRGSEFSTRAAGASFCVAGSEIDNWLPFHKSMMENQPDEMTTGLRNAQMVAIAEEAGVEEDIEQCIDNDTFEEYAGEASEEALKEGGVKGTPTFMIDGVISNVRDPEQLKAVVEASKNRNQNEDVLDTSELEDAEDDLEEVVD